MMITVLVDDDHGDDGDDNHCNINSYCMTSGE